MYMHSHEQSASVECADDLIGRISNTGRCRETIADNGAEMYKKKYHCSTNKRTQKK